MQKTNLYLFAHTIPAEQGYFALDLRGDVHTHKIYLHKEPVIAWFIEVERGKQTPSTFVTPICQDALSDLYQGAVLRPDGKVVISGTREWESFEAYRAHVAWDEYNVPTAVANKLEADNNARFA